MLLYPNPGTDQVTLVWDALPGDEWVLTDLRGRKVLEESLKDRQTVFSTSGLPRGLYLYQVLRQGRNVKSGKWLKM